MGYTKPTFKTATALDYAEIDHYNKSKIASLMGQTIDPLDMSVKNITEFGRRNLNKDGSSKGYNFSSSNKGINYTLELGLPQAQKQNSIMEDSTNKNISRQNLDMENLVGDSYAGKGMFEEAQSANRPSNPAASQIAAAPDLGVPLDEERVTYSNTNDELGGKFA